MTVFWEGEADTLHEECGVFGILGHPEAAALTVLGLHALQHRGQEATGIVSCDGSNFEAHRVPEMVGAAYADPAVMERLKGSIAIGHNRYSTAGGADLRNIQPLYAALAFGGFSLAHNGNLTNTDTLKKDLVKQGALFQSTSDTEVVVHLMARASEESPADKLIAALKQVEGAYALIACAENLLMGVRDPHGIRPLVLGRLDEAYVLASETCALDIVGATYERDIAPGEMVVINEGGLQSLRPFENKPSRFCIFEYIYFARPDSVVEGLPAYEVRKRIGAVLAREAPCETADLIVPVPDSGVPSAIGYAAESGKPFELGIIRSHYIGRTFIQPTQATRKNGVKLKHNANSALLNGKSVVLVDDSLVRGTTSQKIVTMVRQAGAKEVHMRIACPPTTHSCFYGIDTPSKEELLAHRMSVPEIRDFIGVDSLAYLSLDGLYKAVADMARDPSAPQYCDACLTGDYAVKVA